MQNNKLQLLYTVMFLSVMSTLHCSASIDTAALSHDKKVKLVLTMFTDLVDVSSFQFDLDQCLKFTLTVAKSYRNVEYHNWDHAFSVAHCMYWLLKGSPERFSDIEVHDNLMTL